LCRLSGGQGNAYRVFADRRLRELNDLQINPETVLDFRRNQDLRAHDKMIGVTLNIDFIKIFSSLEARLSDDFLVTVKEKSDVFRGSLRVTK
jgi:hypothetical protein